MRSKISQSIFAFIAVTLAVIFIGLTIKQTDFQVLKEAAARANYFWFLASMVLSIFSYWLRAKRWTFLLERSEEHTSELQSRGHLVCRLLLEKKKKKKNKINHNIEKQHKNHKSTPIE